MCRPMPLATPRGPDHYVSSSQGILDTVTVCTWPFVRWVDHVLYNLLADRSQVILRIELSIEVIMNAKQTIVQELFAIP